MVDRSEEDWRYVAVARWIDAVLQQLGVSDIEC